MMPLNENCQRNFCNFSFHEKFLDSFSSEDVLLINLLCFPDKKKGMAMSLFYTMDYDYVLQFFTYSTFHCIMCLNVARYDMNKTLRQHFIKHENIVI